MGLIKKTIDATVTIETVFVTSANVKNTAATGVVEMYRKSDLKYWDGPISATFNSATINTITMTKRGDAQYPGSQFLDFDSSGFPKDEYVVIVRDTSLTSQNSFQDGTIILGADDDDAGLARMALLNELNLSEAASANYSLLDDQGSALRTGTVKDKDSSNITIVPGSPSRRGKMS